MVFTRTTGAALAALLAALPATAADLPGQAQNEIRVQRAWVSADTPATARRSLSLLGRAAMEACGASVFSLPDYQREVRQSPCWQASMAGALAQAGDPALTDAFHRRATVELLASAAAGGTHLR